MKLTNSDKLEVVNHCLHVNGKPFVVDSIGDEIIWAIEDGRLVTLFKGHLENYWNPEEIEGYWA
jgi:hypothetical protein